MLGNGRLEAKCQDGETRLGQIRGQMRKKVSLCFYDLMILILVWEERLTRGIPEFGVCWYGVGAPSVYFRREAGAAVDDSMSAWVDMGRERTPFRLISLLSPICGVNEIRDLRVTDEGMHAQSRSRHVLRTPPHISLSPPSPSSRILEHSRRSCFSYIC